MNKAQAAARTKAVAIFQRNFPDVKDPARLQDDLYVLGIQCQRNAERICNEDRYEDQRDALHKKLEKIKAKHGVEFDAEIGGDPRGFCLKVKLPLGDYNSWGGAEDGYGFGAPE